jgi:hypothetical protein
VAVERTIKPNTQGLTILTDTGYQSFSSVAYMGDKAIYRLEFESGDWLECTDDHKIYIDEQTSIVAGDLRPGDTVLALMGNLTVKAAFHTGRIEPVYDIMDVGKNNRFYGNDILISNCEFIAYDETLVNSIFLSNMHEGSDPYRKTGQVRWYAPIVSNKLYVVSLDPSLGTGGDPAAIQVISLPDLVQVGEWQHNKTAIPGQIKVMKEICDLIQSEAGNGTEIYWSIENNTIGEAALITIQEMGEENIPGTFISEPKKTRSSRTLRRGFNTTHGTKLAACAKLKQWVEKEKLKINSKNLVKELKTFVARGTTFKAKEGENDDLVMSLIIAIRMIDVVSKYDEETFDKVRESFDSGTTLPMPVGFL